MTLETYTKQYNHLSNIELEALELERCGGCRRIGPEGFAQEWDDDSEQYLCTVCNELLLDFNIKRIEGGFTVFYKNGHPIQVAMGEKNWFPTAKEAYSYAARKSYVSVQHDTR